MFFLVTINELGIWAQPLYKLLAQNLPGKGYYGALFQFNQREESWGRGSHKSRFWQESNSVVRDGWILIYFWHVYAFSSVHNFNHSTRSEGGSAANINKCLWLGLLLCWRNPLTVIMYSYLLLQVLKMVVIFFFIYKFLFSPVSNLCVKIFQFITI